MTNGNEGEAGCQGANMPHREPRPRRPESELYLGRAKPLLFGGSHRLEDEPNHRGTGERSVCTTACSTFHVHCFRGNARPMYLLIIGPGHRRRSTSLLSAASATGTDLARPRPRRLALYSMLIAAIMLIGSDYEFG